jgi:RNA polymerase sigma-70 factor (ECF subfamily)
MTPDDFRRMRALGARPRESVETDEALVKRACAGDPMAFASLVDRHGQDGVAAACGLLQDRAEAEEAVQESFVRAWESLGTLRDRSRFKGWFSGILYRVCRDALRARGRTRKALGLSEAGRPAGEARPGALDPVVEEALELPEQYREPLVLFYLQELTVAELAEALGITEENARVRLHRARRMLRERLERKGFGPRGGTP